jgi:glycine cleavage system pyridoxal-binding protein P
MAYKQERQHIKRERAEVIFALLKFLLAVMAGMYAIYMVQKI